MLTAAFLLFAFAGEAQTPAASTTPSAVVKPVTRSAYVQGTLNLAIGERVTLRRQSDGSYALEKVERIEVADVMPPREGDAAAVSKLNGAPSGTIRLALHGRKDVGSLLKVEDGTGEGLKYSAFIVRIVGGKKDGPVKTNVCSIPGGLAAFEHWPQPVIQVVAAGFEPSADKVPVCEKAEATPG